MKFKYTLGIELTSIPEKPFDVEDKKVVCSDGSSYMTRDWEGHRIFVSKITRKLGKLKNPNYSPHTDSHCFEVPSPIFKDSETMKKWFIKVRGIMRKNGLKPHHEDTVCGGGHIHVGIVDQELQDKLIKFVRHHYFLPWIFSQPDEEGACDNWCPREHKGWDKEGSVRDNGPTVEFRFFESALNWPEQWDHVVFVNRYVDWVKKARNTHQKTKYTMKELNKITQKQTIKSFKALLTKLKLPYSRYEKYVIRNLEPRWELDRVRR